MRVNAAAYRLGHEGESIQYPPRSRRARRRQLSASGFWSGPDAPQLRYLRRHRRQARRAARRVLKCERKGRYSVAKLNEKYGRKGNLMKWREQLNGDCPIDRPLRGPRSTPTCRRCFGGLNSDALAPILLGMSEKRIRGSLVPFWARNRALHYLAGGLRAVRRTPSPIDAGRSRLCWPLR